MLHIFGDDVDWAVLAADSVQLFDNTFDTFIESSRSVISLWRPANSPEPDSDVAVSSSLLLLQ